MKHIPIGTVLKERGSITEEQLQEALQYQTGQTGNRRLGAILEEMGFVSEQQILAALAEKLNLQILPLETFPIDIEAVKKIPRSLALKYRLLAVAMAHSRLTVVIDDPLNFYGIEEIRQAAAMDIDIALAERAKIDRAIDVYYSEIETKAVAEDLRIGEEEAIAALEEAAADADAIDADAAPVVRILNSLLLHGYNIGASDIHIEPLEKEVRIRVRVDGMLIPYLTLARSLHPPLVARAKILANMDIAERRLPQDGHFKTRVESVGMNLRVSSVPTIHGEKVVLRFLDSSVAIVHAHQFGMNEANYIRFQRMLSSPNGVVYITGPTGSGKTTTLYLALESLVRRQSNISTIEDPVERHLAGVNQIEVNQAAGLTFTSGLRALLRQDPDIIMVGETRDSETAAISVRSAITGHLVLSTLHTNDAISSIVRLEDMGIEPYLVANSVAGLVAQRLVRLICPHCREEYSGSDQEKRLVGADLPLHRGRGCPACNQTGYRGRIAVHETVEIDGAIRKMISERRPIDDVYRYAREGQHFVSFREEALNLVIEGTTTTEELMKLSYYLD